MDWRQGYCCGTAELSGISNHRTAPEILARLCASYGSGWIKPQLIFTTAGPKDEEVAYGERLKNLIEKENLGTVTRSACSERHNTGNYITVYVWTVNHKNLRAYLLKAKLIPVS